MKSALSRKNLTEEQIITVVQIRMGVRRALAAARIAEEQVINGQETESLEQEFCTKVIEAGDEYRDLLIDDKSTDNILDEDVLHKIIKPFAVELRIQRNITRKSTKPDWKVFREHMAKVAVDLFASEGSPVTIERAREVMNRKTWTAAKRSRKYITREFVGPVDDQFIAMMGNPLGSSRAILGQMSPRACLARRLKDILEEYKTDKPLKRELRRRIKTRKRIEITNEALLAYVGKLLT